MLGVAALALVAGLLWGWQKWSYWRVHVSTDNAQVDGHVLPVLAPPIDPVLSTLVYPGLASEQARVDRVNRASQARRIAGTLPAGPGGRAWARAPATR